MWACLFLALMFSAVLLSTAFAFRCGRKLVETGDTTVEVLGKCGEPTYREVVGTETRGGYRGTTEEVDEDLSLDRGYYRELRVRVERWYYDFGPHKFVRILTFRGGILYKIERGEYGTARPEVFGPSGSEPEKPVNGEEQELFIYGRISVSGMPYGARVYLDGEHVGNIPCILEQIPVGAHNIIVREEGYRDWAKRVIVSAGRTAFVSAYPETLEVKPPGAAGGKEAKPGEPPAKPGTKIYKWTDDKGHIHITDSPPPAGRP